MTTHEILTHLRKAAKDSYRRTYLKHGADDSALGVSTADLKSLQKKLRTNDNLARELWASGIHEARILATMITDPKAADAAMLDSWAADARTYLIADYVAELASRSPHAKGLAERWSRSDSEVEARAGWSLMARLADDLSLPDGFFERRLEIIEQAIHRARNRVKESMHGSLIAIGGRSDALAERAVAAARRIGKIEIDHGETACKTPDAEAYIFKIRAHRKKTK